MAVVSVVTPESTLGIPDSPSTSGLLGGLRSPGTASWLGLKIPLLDHPSARKNRANNPPWPSERRASHHTYPKRHPASSWPQSPAQSGVRMWSTWQKFMSCGQFPTSQRVEPTNLQTACCGREKKQLVNWANTDKTHSPGKVASEQSVSGSIKENMCTNVAYKDRALLPSSSTSENVTGC